MAKWSAIFTKEALREIVSNLLWSYWPYWGAPAMSAFLLASEGHSYAVIFTGTLFAFAMTAMGLNNLSQWLVAKTPADKVSFAMPAFILGYDSKNLTELRGLKLGVNVRSSAPFPMEIRIDSMETQIADKVPVQDFIERSETVHQGNMAQFTNALIKLSKTQRRNAVLYGRIKAAISYGRPGNLKYKTGHQYYLLLKFDKEGNFLGGEVSNTQFSGPIE